MGPENSSPFLINLRGNFHEGNFGDDALMLACVSLLQRQAKQINFEKNIAYRDERTQRIYSGDFEMNLSDIIVYGGGTQFFSFSGPVRRQSILSRMVAKLSSPRSLVASYNSRKTAAHERGISKIAIGIGVGPFKNQSAAEQTVNLLRKMELVWVRDAASEEFCRSNEIPNLVVSADLCFTDAFQEFIVKPIASSPPRNRRRKKIAIILRDWPGLQADFFQRKVALAGKLRASGHEVRFLALSNQDEDYLAAMAALGETVSVWDAKSQRLEDFWSLVAEQDLVVTSRFHGAIFALLSSVPFLAIEIEPKLRNLREMVPDLGNFAAAPDTPVEEIHVAVDNILSRHEFLQAALGRALSEQRSLARVGENALKSYFVAKSKNEK